MCRVDYLFAVFKYRCVPFPIERIENDKYEFEISFRNSRSDNYVFEAFNHFASFEAPKLLFCTTLEPKEFIAHSIAISV